MIYNEIERFVLYVYAEFGVTTNGSFNFQAGDFSDEDNS